MSKWGLQLADTGNVSIFSEYGNDLTVGITTDSKAAQKVMKIAKKNSPDMMFMGIIGKETRSGRKIMVFVLVPEVMNTVVYCKENEWIRSTLEVCDGRCGGKP